MLVREAGIHYLNNTIMMLRSLIDLLVAMIPVREAYRNHNNNNNSFTATSGDQFDHIRPIRVSDFGKLYVFRNSVV